MSIENKIENLERKTREYTYDLRVIVRRQPLNELLAILSSFLWPNELAWEDLRRRTRNNNQLLTKIKIFIPSLAKFAIINSNNHVGQSNRNIDDFYRDLLKAIDLIIEIKDWLPFNSFPDADFAYSAWQFVLANQQFPLQENPKNHITRYFQIYKRIPLEMNSQLNIDGAFQHIFGVPIERFWLLILKTLLGYKGAWVKEDKFLGLNEGPYNITEKEFTNFFNTLSVDYSGFKVLSKNESFSLTGSSTQFYGFTPFDQFPTIKNESEILILSPYYLAKKLSYSVYFDLLHFFQNGEDPRRNPFSNEFGLVFENYVGKQLNNLNDGGELIHEFEFDTDNKKFTDWSLLYGDQLILIEVKKSLLPNSIKFLMDKVELKNVLKRNIIYGLKQCYSKINHIKNETRGLELFSDTANFYPLIVVFDDSYLLNNYFIRRIIDEVLAEEEIVFEKNWQIITVRELENIVNVCSEEKTLLSILQEKIVNEDNIFMDWDKYLASIDIEIGENELLEETFKEELELINAI